MSCPGKEYPGSLSARNLNIPYIDAMYPLLSVKELTETILSVKTAGAPVFSGDRMD